MDSDIIIIETLNGLSEILNRKELRRVHEMLNTICIYSVNKAIYGEMLTLTENMMVN